MTMLPILFDREYRPYRWFEDMFDDLFEVQTSPSQRTNALNIKENDNAYVMEFAIPGIKKEDCNITCENGFLNVSVESQKSTEENNHKFIHKEFSYSSFKQSYKLPKGIKEEDISAKVQDGVLTVNMPKPKPVEHEKKVKQITVQ